MRGIQLAKLKGAAKAAFLKRINKGRVKAGLKKIHSKTKQAVKRRTTKRRNPTKKKTTRRKSSSSSKKTVVNRKGASMKTRLVKFGAGAGIATVIAAIAIALKRTEINAAAPILDAAAGTGVEGQIGTAIVRTVMPLITNGLKLNGNSMNGLAVNGA